MFNYIWYRFLFKISPWINRGFPVHLDIELAGKCQLACNMCPFGDGSFDDSMQGMMRRDIAEKAIKEGAREGAKSLKLNFRGEPGLSKHLIPMIHLAKKLNYTEVMINTNFTAFSKYRIEQLIKSGIDKVIVSIDGGTQETYERIRVKGNFKKLIQNMNYLNFHRKDSPEIVVQMTVQESNKREQEQVRRLFKADKYSFKQVRQTNNRDRKRCGQPFQRLVVAWDGTVFGCCGNWNNEFPIGDFNKQTLKEIWQGQKMKELRRFAKDPNKGFPCLDCKVGDSYV